MTKPLIVLYVRSTDLAQMWRSPLNWAIMTRPPESEEAGRDLKELIDDGDIDVVVLAGENAIVGWHIETTRSVVFVPPLPGPVDPRDIAQAGSRIVHRPADMLVELDADAKLIADAAYAADYDAEPAIKALVRKAFEAGRQAA